MDGALRLRAVRRDIASLCRLQASLLKSVAAAGIRAHPNPYLNKEVETKGLKLQSNAVKSSGKNPADALNTESPIKHVIILIGENRGLITRSVCTRPKGKKQTDFESLPSKESSTRMARQGRTMCRLSSTRLRRSHPSISARRNRRSSFYNASSVMPQPNTGGTPTARATLRLPFKTVAEASAEKDMNPADLDIVTTGVSGLAKNVLDTRVPGAGTLSGPFPMQGPQLSDDDYTGDTSHRFYSDRQQDDCSVANVTKDDNAGCKKDLFPFVMATNSPSSAGNSMGF